VWLAGVALGIAIVALFLGVLVLASPASRSSPWKLIASFHSGIGRDAADNLSSISCPSQSVCEVVGSSGNFSDGVIFKTSDAGRQWIRLFFVPNVLLESITCPSISFCVAAGISPSALSPVLTIPEVSGGSIWTSDDSGARWTRGILPRGRVPAIGGVYCSAAGDCLAAAESVSSSEILRSTNYGASWSVASTLPRGLTLFTVTCASRSLCIAAGARDSTRGEIMRSTDGGSTWTGVIPRGQYLDFVRGVTCLSSTSCVAVGDIYSVWTTNDAGRTWTYRATPIDIGDLSGVSCIGRLCTAVGQANSATVQSFSGPHGVVLRSDDAGRHWLRRATINSTFSLDGIACVSRSLCWIASSTDPNNGAIFSVT
jgi:photosystem II stability/assembly factor-like uncharacterized protein